MFTQTLPDTMTKMAKVAEATQFEPVGDQPQQEQRHTPYQSRSLAECITQVATPSGKRNILKTMVTTACERNCYYCPFRAGRGKMKRLTFSPDELAKGLDTLQRAGQVEGMFLSSGIIKGSVTTQDKIIDTADIVRNRYHYRVYLHLKVMPGIEYEQLYRLMQLADRVSVNLEGPTQERLDALAPKKNFKEELLKMLHWAELIRRSHPGEKLANTVTQFVVGAVGDTDLELLSLSERLYRRVGLTRAYYSAFRPVEQTPFEQLAPVDPLREQRLYQASFLLRDYGWRVDELALLAEGNLPLDVDPKKAWAEQHLRHNPVNLMTAERTQLLRVPGIGPRGADAILRARRKGDIRSIVDLRHIGITAPEKTLPYILLAGGKTPEQLSLF